MVKSISKAWDRWKQVHCLKTLYMERLRLHVVIPNLSQSVNTKGETTGLLSPLGKEIDWMACDERVSA